MKIDWNEAPEWAVAHALYAFGGEISEVWVGEDKWQRLDVPLDYPYGGAVGDSRHNPRRYQFKYETPRPAPWTGEGLPPVGAVCELWCGGSDGWIPCAVMAHDVEMAIPIAVVRYGNQCYTGSSAKTLRPIRTPEQIAAEERKVATDEMVSVACKGRGMTITLIKEIRSYCEALYDAGCRMQVKQ